MGVDQNTPRVIDPRFEDHEPGARAAVVVPDLVRSAQEGEPGYDPDYVAEWEIRLDGRVLNSHGPRATEFVARFDTRAGFVDVYDPSDKRGWFRGTQTRHYGRVEARKLS